MKKFKFGLLPRIITAIILGVVFGLFLPLPLVRIFATFNSIFSNLLQFMIPLIIFGLVTPAIADIGEGAGKLLLITVVVAYLDTVFAGCFSYVTSVSVFPSLIDSSQKVDVAEIATSVDPFFTISIPPVMEVMSSLVLAFMVGLGVAFFGSVNLRNICREFKDIVA